MDLQETVRRLDDAIDNYGDYYSFYWLSEESYDGDNYVSLTVKAHSGKDEGFDWEEIWTIDENGILSIDGEVWGPVEQFLNYY